MKWGLERNVIQRLLGNSHTSDDQIIDLSSHFNGDTKHNIHQRRDIFKYFKNASCLFFLNYDGDNLLFDIEIHNGVDIKLKHITISFDDDINLVLKNIKSISESFRELNNGNYFFKDLNLVVADEESMGGDGNNLGYFYCSINTEHLEPEF